MRRAFSAHSTTGDVLSGIDLRGKRIVVTGASAGLGTETCRALVRHGADIVGTVRDLQKGQQTAASLRDEAHDGLGSFSLVELDLASLNSVRDCSAALTDRGDGFDVIIANAGVMMMPFQRTEDGFEAQFATNHLGHFLFVNRIAPLLRDGGRVVVLSSAGHRFADVDLEDPSFLRTDYHPATAYSRSKTANVLFAAEFDRRHAVPRRRATAVHPGAIMETDLSRYMTDRQIEAMLDSVRKTEEMSGGARMTMKTIPQGAATTVWAAIVADTEEIGGRYCEDCHVARISDGPEFTGVRSYALDPVRAARLWSLSEEMVGETF